MRSTLRLGRIAGVTVGLNWSLLVMVAVVAAGLADKRFSLEAPGYPGNAYALAGGLTALGLLLGVLMHEFGHALVARRLGLKVDGITLTWMGGVTRIDGEAARPGSEFLIASVGPVVSAAFGGSLWLARTLAEAGGAGHLAVAALGWLAGINVILAVFNLLPAAPLDGGRVLHSAIWAATRDRWRATRAASATGIGLGALLVVAGFSVMAQPADPVNGLIISIIGWWMLASARAEFGVGAVQRSLQGVRLCDVMRPVAAAPGWITVRAFADQYASGRPGAVWMLENWGGGFGGVILGDAIAGVPLPQWDLMRPLDMAVPISSTVGGSPYEEVLQALASSGGHKVILVVEGGNTVGAVLPSDIEAMVRFGRRGPVGSAGWSLVRH